MKTDKQNRQINTHLIGILIIIATIPGCDLLFKHHFFNNNEFFIDKSIAGTWMHCHYNGTCSNPVQNEMNPILIIKVEKVSV